MYLGNLDFQSSVRVRLHESIAFNLNLILSGPWGTTSKLDKDFDSSARSFPPRLTYASVSAESRQPTGQNNHYRDVPTTGRKREKQDNWSKRPPCYKGTMGLLCSSCGLPVDSWEGDTSHWNSYGWMDMTRDFWIWGASQFSEHNPNIE